MINSYTYGKTATSVPRQLTSELQNKIISGYTSGNINKTEDSYRSFREAFGQNDPVYELRTGVLTDSKNRTIFLKKSIMFRIETDLDGTYYYISDKYNICAAGDTQEEARNNIIEELEVVYDAYANDSDETLDDGALQLKHDLLALLSNNYGVKN